LGTAAPDWFALQPGPIAECVKRGHQRSTWRVALGSERTIFAKMFDDSGKSLLALWRRWTHNTPAEREWRASLSLRARGVPVVQPLALGVLRGPQRGFVLLTKGVDGATNLAQTWSALRTATSQPSEQSRTNALISTVARLLAVSHERGFAHPDCHPQNILVFTSAEGDPAALFVDVAAGLTAIPSARATGGVSTRRALRSLAQLDQYFRHSATRAQRLRFWRYYGTLRASSRNFPTTPHLLPALARESAMHSAALARQRDRRIRRDGKYFARLKLGGGWRATVTLNLERRHLFPEPRVPDRTAEEWRALLQSVVMSSTSDRQVGCDATIRCVRYRPQGVLACVIESLVGSEARRVFERCHRLRHRDIAAPLTLAYCERRGLMGLLRESVLIVPICGGSEGAEQRERASV